MSVQALTDWLALGRADIARVAVETRENNRGLYATHPVAAGYTIAAIPGTHVLTEERVKSSPVAQHLLAGNVKVNDGFFMAYLMAERLRGDSFWAPYLSTLPTGYPWMPHCHAAVLAPLLGETRALQIIRRNVSWLRAARHIAAHCVPDLQDVGLDDYTWVYFVVRSRTLLKDPKIAPRDALVPLLDMCNHSLAPNARLTSDDTGGYQVVAERTILAGEEITVNYGLKSNSVLFARYGFTQSGNPTHETVLYVPSRTNPKAPTECRVRTDFAHEDTRKLLGLLREYEHGHKRVDMQSERAVLVQLRSLAQEAHRRMSRHTMQAPLEDGPISGQEDLVAHAARVCDDERHVLDWCMQLAQEAVPVLAMGGSERAEAIGAAAQGHGPFAAYFRSLAE